MKAFNKGLILPTPLNFYIHWRSSTRVYFSTGVKLLYSLKIFIDDDDDDGDGDDYDDDDDVERTRTGPFAARSDLEHQVNHNAKISYFYHVFSSYEEGGPTGAGKTRCLAVTIL